MLWHDGIDWECCGATSDSNARGRVVVSFIEVRCRIWCSFTLLSRFSGFLTKIVFARLRGSRRGHDCFFSFKHRQRRSFSFCKFGVRIFGCSAVAAAPSCTRQRNIFIAPPAWVAAQVKVPPNSPLARRQSRQLLLHTSISSSGEGTQFISSQATRRWLYKQSGTRTAPLFACPLAKPHQMTMMALLSTR